MHMLDRAEKTTAPCILAQLHTEESYKTIKYIISVRLVKPEKERKQERRKQSKKEQDAQREKFLPFCGQLITLGVGTWNYFEAC